jgi:hypothetical protein
VDSEDKSQRGGRRFVLGMGSGVPINLPHRRLVLLEGGMRMSRKNIARKVIAAILYVVGAVAVLLVAYKFHLDPPYVMDYFLWYWIGVVLVGTAGLMWPKSERNHAAEEEETT